MDGEGRWGSGEDDTSPEVEVRGGRLATEAGPRPDAAPVDEVRVIDDPDATASISAGEGRDEEPVEAQEAQLPLDEAVPQPSTPSRRAARTEPGDDLDAWSSFATSGPRWRDQRPSASAEDETSLSPGARPRPPRRDRQAAAEEAEARAPGGDVVPDAELGIPSRLGRRWRRSSKRHEPEETAGDRSDRARGEGRRRATGGASIGARRRRSEDEGTGAVSASGPPPEGGSTEGPDATGEPVLRPASRIVRGRPRPSTSEPTDAARPAAAADRDLPRAIAFGVGFAAVALLAFAIGPAMAVAFVTVVIALAGIELFAALQRSGFQPATLLGLVATTALPLAAYWRGEPALPLVLALTVVATFLWYLTGVSRVSPTLNTAVTVLGVGYVGLLGAFAALLLAFPNGTGALIGVILAVVANDTGALVVGRRAGRRLLAPEISPRKTWEGVIGGAVASVVVSVVVLGIIGLAPWDAGSALALGLVVGVTAPLGDLCESMIKRDLGVKDMGAVLPGHGGLLDRFDALLFTLPAAYYLCRLLEVF